jgi:hypothetical protein
METGLVDRSERAADGQVAKRLGSLQLCLSLMEYWFFEKEDLVMLGEAGQEMLRTLEDKVPA